MRIRARKVLYVQLHSQINGLLDLGNPLNTGWTVTEGRGINDSGWITGYGTHNGNQHAFLMQPVPEPGTLVLLGLGLPLGLAWFKRRRAAQ